MSKPRTYNSKLDELRNLWRWAADRRVVTWGADGAYWASRDMHTNDLREHAGPAVQPWEAVRELRAHEDNRGDCYNGSESKNRNNHAGKGRETT